MSMKSTALACLAMLAWWSGGLTNPAPVVARHGAAQNDARSPGTQDPNAGLVAVGGVEILRIRVAAPGHTVEERANTIQSRLVPILADPTLRPSDVHVEPNGADYKLMVKSRLLVTVTRQDAAATDSTPGRLAARWAAHVRRVLPQVSVRPNPKLEGSKPHSR